MSLAVALATYNGGKHLREQLESLAAQTRLPDELVISDDGSTDETLAIARHFQRHAPFETHISQADRRLGPMDNFLRAARACRSEYVAFCDQDDIWLPSKLRVCEDVLRRNQAWVVTHSVGRFRVEAGTRAHHEPMGVPSATIDGLRIAPNSMVLGMSMVIRKQLLEAGWPLKELWEPRFDRIARTRPVTLIDHWSHAHDMYAMTIARLLGTIALVGDVLAWHRVHERNYSTAGSDREAAWQQPEDVASRWGTHWTVGYRALSEFCGEFAEMIRQAPPLDGFTASRRRDIAAHYERWASLWRSRAALHLDRQRPLVRFRELYALARNGAYRSRYAGGFGLQSLVKDGGKALTLFAVK